MYISTHIIAAKYTHFGYTFIGRNLIYIIRGQEFAVSLDLGTDLKGLGTFQVFDVGVHLNLHISAIYPAWP